MVRVVRRVVRVLGSEKLPEVGAGMRRALIELKKAGRHEHGCTAAMRLVDVGAGAGAGAETEAEAEAGAEAGAEAEAGPGGGRGTSSGGPGFQEKTGGGDEMEENDLGVGGGTGPGLSVGKLSNCWSKKSAPTPNGELIGHRQSAVSAGPSRWFHNIPQIELRPCYCSRSLPSVAMTGTNTTTVNVSKIEQRLRKLERRLCLVGSSLVLLGSLSLAFAGSAWRLWR